MKEMLVIKEADLGFITKQVTDLSRKVDKLTTTVEGPVDIKTAAEHLGVSVKTIRRKMSEGLPFHKFGQLDRFYLAEINEWLKDH